MAEITPDAHRRELRLILGAIGALIVFGLVVLIAVVLIYRSAPIRGHPQPTATPTAGTSPAADVAQPSLLSIRREGWWPSSRRTSP